MHNPEVKPQSDLIPRESGMTNGELSHQICTNNMKEPSNPNPPIINECAGCGKSIKDKFILKSMDKIFHSNCLTCHCCSAKLGEIGATLYSKAGLILCKRDYLRMFGSSGYCSACNKEIQPYEFVMRSAKPNLVFHLNCFSCSLCNYRFCVGDRYAIENSKIICEYDHQERMIFKQMSYSPNNLALLRKQVNQNQPVEENQPQEHHHELYNTYYQPRMMGCSGSPENNASLDKSAGVPRKPHVPSTNGDEGAYGSPDSGIRMDAEYN